MPTISEPRTEARTWTYARMRASFARGEIGPETFKVSLMLLGIPERDAKSEVAMMEMERDCSRKQGAVTP